MTRDGTIGLMTTAKRFFIFVFLLMAIGSADGQVPVTIPIPAGCFTPVGADGFVGSGSIDLRLTPFVPIGGLGIIYLCERVTQDPSVAYRRDGAGKLFISALPGAPPVNYTVVFNAEFKRGNTVEPVSIPPTPFDGQIVWCLGQQSPNLAANQIAAMVPVSVIELRSTATTGLLMSSNSAWPNGTHSRWNQHHPICGGGTPGITFATGSDRISIPSMSGAGVDLITSDLLQMWIVSIIPAPAL